MAKQEFFENGYKFTVDDNGTVTAEGTVSENPASRSGMQSINPDGYRDGVNDKGHLIAAREGGPAEDYNVSSQDRSLNRGAYKTVENSEVRLANDGNVVQTEKTAFVSNEGSKPDAYMINDTITTSDGKTQNVHLSFQNMSPDEQAEQNRFLQENDFTEGYPNPDPLRESMTTEEYNSLMNETEQDLPSVKDEFEIDCYSETNFDSEASQAGDLTSGGVQDVGTSTDSGVDSGCEVEM